MKSTNPRLQFDKRAKRYYVQLTVGCGTACNHQLCASHPQFEKISNQRAAIMAIQLASHPRGLYCPRILDSCISSDSVIQSLLSSPKSSPAHSRASSASSLIADNLSVNSDLLLKSPARTKSKLALDDFSADDHKSPEITQNVTFHCSVLLNSINEPVDSKILHTSVRMVFSSTDSLGQCFLDQNSSFGPKIQFFSLNSLLAHFVENDRKLSCVNELCNSIELLLVVAHAHIQKYVPDDYFLRSLLILLEIPFSVNDTFHSLFSGICKLIRNLRSKAKNTLIQWLSTYETAHFCKILEKFKGFIENNSITSITDELVGAIRALGILNQANEARSQNIAISEFYVSRLSLQLDFKNEYRNWKASKIPKSGSNFSFFNYPFLFDPLSKSRFLHIHAMFQMSKEYEQAHVNQALLMKAQQILVRENAESQKLKAAIDPFLLLEVRRECLIDDVCNALGQKISELKKPLKVRFIGSGEQGMDQGGVQKEFFQISIEKMLDPMYGLFVYDSETRISWFNSGCEDHMRNYEYFGILFGLALYNGVMLGLKFPSVLYRKILNEPITLEDIETSFPTIYKNLKQILAYEGDINDLSLSFEITSNQFGVVSNIPLCANGADLDVNNENVSTFVELYVEFLVSKSIERQYQAFEKGFRRVCSTEVLEICKSSELELIICGQTQVNIEELKIGCQYDDGYHIDHTVIKWFWEIVLCFSPELQSSLLNFVTASDRVPLGGLSTLLFVVQRNGPDTDRLPTSLTCFGRLLLPEYSSKEKLKERLQTAIENAQGFGLV